MWDDFLAIDATRRYGMDGPEAIKHMDIDAYSRLFGVLFTASEVRAITLLDNAVRSPREKKTAAQESNTLIPWPEKKTE